MASMEVRLDRFGGIFSKGETVKGVVLVHSKGGISHNGLMVRAEGALALQLSPKAVGIFEAFYNTIAPLKLLSLEIPVITDGKLPDGTTEIPFEFTLNEKEGGVGLLETYHGVFVNVNYSITAELQRGMFAKTLTETLTFNVRNPGQCFSEDFVKPGTSSAVDFSISPKTLRNVKKASMSHIPQFQVTGRLDASKCDISRPLTGHVRLGTCSQRIKSIELQLVRVEYCAASETSSQNTAQVAKEATEIQNIQVADGNIPQNLDIPLFMIFPRWFTCPTLKANNFKVEFEVNLVILLEDNHQITENFPIKLYRRPDDIDGDE
eukprot:TRINITY_DN12878_c1_g1_i1.p1 TRINITY_DN12878_c1_g1~~TRINITY_DN12878_c1_g1_i1.p1  ORF type:complete len:351 (+),score=142.09 TRINITY_DN12878_c1_g1_i1:92-1054(+)